MNGRITLHLGYKNLPLSSFALYRKLQEKIMMNALKLFDKTRAINMSFFWGWLARRVQQPGAKLTDFLGDLKQLVLKAYPTKSQDIRDHLVLRGVLEGINHSQMRLDLRKQIGDKDIKIETVLERALHLEAVTRIEEEEQTPKVAVIRRDETKDLVQAVNTLVNHLSVDDKERENRWNQSRERSSSRGEGVTRDVIENSNMIVGSTIGGDFQRQDPLTEIDLSEEMNRQWGTTRRVSSAEPLDRKVAFWGIVEIVSYVEVFKTWKETALSKRKPTRTVMSFEFVRQTQLNV